MWYTIWKLEIEVWEVKLEGLKLFTNQIVSSIIELIIEVKKSADNAIL